MESLIKLQWLDLRGNKITDLEEINYLSDMKSLQCLFFQGQDGNHQNPICNKENYSSSTQKVLPQLAFLDGINGLYYRLQIPPPFINKILYIYIYIYIYCIYIKY
jgi:hypothetical protein